MDLHEPKSATTQLDLSVDLAGERPTMVAQELRPNPLLRRVAAGIAGAFVATIVVAWIASGDDEVPRRMKPVLGPALPTAVLGVELARMETITADLERELAELPASARRKLAKRSTTDAGASGAATTDRTSTDRATTDAAVPARTVTPRSGATPRGAGDDGLRGLPAAPEPDAPTDAPATPDAADDRALPGVDVPDAENLFEPDPNEPPTAPEPDAAPEPAAAAPAAPPPPPTPS